MRAKRNLLAVVAVLLGCTVAIWFSTSTRGGQKTYELHPQIALPEYRSDAARAIDAYERLMGRYMELTERNLVGIGADVRDIAAKLDSIDRRLTKISIRMAGLEKALGIKRIKRSAAKKTQALTTQKKTGKKSLPSTAE